MSGGATLWVPRALQVLRLPRLSRRNLIVGAASCALLAGAIGAVLGKMGSAEAPAGTLSSQSGAGMRASRVPRAAPVPAPGAQRAADAPASRRASRVAAASSAAALFSPHSWHIEPPPPPSAPPPPPAPPAAPPFPYTFLGVITTGSDKPIYFLSRADRVVDLSVGDRFDGVYEFESADSGQLIFNYLPLNIRQSLPTGASP